MARESHPASGADRLPSIDLFEAMGGSAKCRELATAFYGAVDGTPALRRFFPGKTHKCAIEEFSAFLVQFLDGPSGEAQRRWWLSLRESHGRFTIGLEERDAWMGLMTRVLAKVAMSDPVRSSLQQLFEEASTYLVNTGPAAGATGRLRGNSDLDVQMGRRWEEQVAVDGAVKAVREGELQLVIAAVESPVLRSRFQCNRAVFASFLNVLIGSGHEAMVEYSQSLLHQNPDLAHERYSGRTLLHAAAAAGNLTMVRALLELGVDADIRDGGGHTPLYSVANECPGGGPVVRALIEGGATVDACEGVKRATPLHMAARRDNVEAAEALLESGADIEARDRLGETPLRRAVNCGQPGVARLLLKRGADAHSVGSKGLTPQSAARTGAMRALFRASAR